MTSEQAALLEKAEKSLKAARVLLDEDLFDFSASRAYYTMFYVVEALLLGEGLTFSKHSAVVAAFGKLFVKRGLVAKEFHRYLIEAEDSRNVGDYDIGPGLSREAASLQIERAKEFLKLADELLSRQQER